MTARVVRIVAGAALAAPVLVLAVSPEAHWLLRGAVLATLLLSAWRPSTALVVLAALTPAGLLIGPIPARAAEALVWAFLSGWLLDVRRPLTRGGRPPVLIPAAVIGVCALASWLTLVVREGATLDLGRVWIAIGQSLLRDHLLYTSAEPETWTLLLLLATIAVMAAATVLVRDEPGIALRISAALTMSMAAMSVLSAAAAVYLWSANEHASWFLLRRSAFHLGDLNAAGSQYVLAGLTALGLAMFDRPRRRLWVGLLALMVPGAWLAGSRSAALAGVAAGLLVIHQGRDRPWRLSPAWMTAVATAGVVILLAGAAILARGAGDTDAAGRALRLRMQFAETSARMTASAPVYGVGIGRYHSRSHEFMPAELRAIYPYENAHNYFAQQFAELGLVGGIAFLWLVVAGLRAGAGTLSARDKIAVGLFAGAAGYLVTCLAGHPLLVPEAAMPFGIAFGAAAGAGLSVARPGTGSRPAAVAAAALVLVAAAPLVGAAMPKSPVAPVERGFYEIEHEADGTPFRWTMRHAVTYVPAEPGFLRLTVYAPDGDVRPYALEVRADGALLDTLILDQDNWQTFEVPIRPRRKSDARNRRIDLRIDRVRTRTLGSGLVEPLGVMVREVRLMPTRYTVPSS